MLTEQPKLADPSWHCWSTRKAALSLKQTINKTLTTASHYLRRLCLPVLAFACISPVYSATIEELRVWRAPDHTRLVFDLSSAVAYKLFTLDNPARVVVDIADSVKLPDLSQVDLSDSPIGNIRTGLRDGNTLRVVLDLNAQVNPESFTLVANGEFRDRLVVDLFDKESPEFSTARTVPSSDRASDKRDIRVAVVAGHGGEDPGALSHDRRIMEKDVTLAIARAVRDRLDATPGYQAVMIRDGDYSVELTERPKIGRQNRVDIYLSIHADSYRGRSATGVTIYALSGETADRENARRIAQKENRADLLGGMEGDTNIADVEDDLAMTLLQLSMDWSLGQSVELGSHILKSMGQVATLRRDKVQQGNLWELRSPDIPSILIETGYLSNPSEADKLAAPWYQRQLAGSIVQGVMNYFQERPPVDSLVAWQVANGIKPEPFLPGSYNVVPGDSLSVIAQRFGVSLSQLKSANKLNSNTIHAGQTLILPGAADTGVTEHKIREGETLSEIAELYRVRLSLLRQLNNISGDRILVGQLIKIPLF